MKIITMIILYQRILQVKQLKKINILFTETNNFSIYIQMHIYISQMQDDAKILFISSFTGF